MKIRFALPAAAVIGGMLVALLAMWLGFRWGSPLMDTSAAQNLTESSVEISRPATSMIGSVRDNVKEQAARCLFPVPQWGKAVLPEMASSLSLAQSRVQATAKLQPGTLRPLRELHVGQRVLLPLADGEVVEAVVKLILPDDAGWVRVGGAFLGTARGEFSLAQKIDTPGQWAGRILHHDPQLGYQLASTDAGLLLHRKPLASMVCQGIPRSPNQPPAGLEASRSSVSVLAAQPALDSKPDAVGVLYLDFDGEQVSDPDWNSGFTIVAQPALLGGYPITTAQITDVWQRVAEDFKPFNVSVTTNRARYDSAPPGARALCIITPSDSWFYASVGGVAYLRSYRGPGEGFSSTIPCWVFNNSTKSDMALTCSHELGHMVGLSHDGTGILTYYGGHDSGVTSWGPIMGAPWGRRVTHWSIGDYPTADNQEDDLDVVSQIIAEPLSLASGMVQDEAGGTRATAAVLDVVATVNRSGIISSRTDADYYKLTTAGGLAKITGTPATTDANLDVQLTLYNELGGVVTTSLTQTGSLAANVTATLSPGIYYIEVRGKGRLADNSGFTPVIGYTNYGSAGAYVLTGSYVPLPVTPLFIQQPMALTTVTQGAKVTLSAKTLSNTGVSYQWKKNNINMPGKTTATLVLSSVQAADAATYIVVAKNSAGEVPSDPAVLVVNYKPLFSLQPLPAKSTVATGADVTFSVAAHGTAPVTLQWWKNGVNLDGETAPPSASPAWTGLTQRATR